MFEETLDNAVDAAQTKTRLADKKLGAYLIYSGMAGAYLALAITLIFKFGIPLHRSEVLSPLTGFMMAATFGIALSLVLAAGSDLFTGNTMLMSIALLRGEVNRTELLRAWFWGWTGNLLGAGLVGLMVWQAGIFDPNLQLDSATLMAENKLIAVANAKTTGSESELFFRAILCNWLVTLAVWSYIKMDNEVAKLIMVWWCLLAFIGSGYEHSVANMGLLTISNLYTLSSPVVTWTGMAYNLVIVTAGNIVSGALFMGGAYWYLTEADQDSKAEVQSAGIERGASAAHDDD